MEEAGDRFHVCCGTVTVILQHRATQIVTNPIMGGSGRYTTVHENKNMHIHRSKLSVY